MRAFDNLGSAIVAANALHQGIIRFAGVFGDEDVAGAAQISRRLAQRASRKKEFITKRSLPIHKDDVQPMFEMEILQTVVQQQRIDLPFFDGQQTAFDTVFVHEDDHVLQVMREHVRLIAGST